MTTSTIEPSSFVTSPEIRERAQEALEYLEEHPTAHNQNFWFKAPGREYTEHVDWTRIKVEFDEQGEPNICGTQMCLAGTVQFQEYGIKGLRKFSRNNDAAWAEAGELLGLGRNIAHDVFHQTGSNEKARDMLRNIANGVHPYTGISGWSSRIQ